MLRAVIASTPSGHYGRTTLYNDGLDTTEKGMVSYWLGMTTAMAVARSELEAAWMVHVDHLLHANGLPLRGTRPDLVGCSRSGEARVVEVKGRTHGFASRAIDSGKTQLADSRYLFLSTHGPTTHYVHESFFDRDGSELAVHLEDPEPRGRTTHVPVEEVCGGFYDALARTVQQGDRFEGPEDFIVSEFESLGMIVGLHESFQPAMTFAAQRRPRMATSVPAKPAVVGEEPSDIVAPEQLPDITMTAFGELGTELLPIYDSFQETDAYHYDRYAVRLSIDGALIGLDERWTG